MRPITKLNQIQSELLEISGGKFQKLCDSLIHIEKPGKVCSWGSVLGKNKPQTGTPDSYIKLENGNYIFIEYTTQQSDVYNKLNEDLSKCFNEDKTGVPIEKIEKIILCYNSMLKPDKLNKLEEKCKKHECLLDYYDITGIGFKLLYDYPNIAKELLNIEIDTGQILTPKKFIEQKSKYSTPLDNEFMFRNEKLEDISKSLDQNNLIIITGKPGVGKTRIAIEAMNKYNQKNENNYNLFCIKNKNLSIYKDLKAYFSKDEKAIILVDDANRVSQLNIILDLLYNRNNIKIIITVRDYGLKTIKNMIFDIPYNQIVINDFNRSKLFDLLQSDDIGVTNPTYLQRIYNISKGNPRLALMGAKVAKKTNNLKSLSNAVNIYDNFYKEIFDNIREKEDQDLFKVLSIISYFRILKINSNIFNEICQKFGLDKQIFLEKAKILYDLELIDLYEKEIFKITDQIQANYFFYYFVIKEEIISFDMFLSNFFFGNEAKMKEIIFPLVNIFDYSFIENRIKEDIDNLWNKYKCNEEKLFKIADVFWFLNSTKILNYIYQKINLMKKKNSTYNFKETTDRIKDKYLSILKNFVFLSKDEFKLSLEIIFLYLEKRPELLAEVKFYLKRHIGYDITSYQSGYYQQIILFKFLISNTNNYKYINDLINDISVFFLKVFHETTWSEGRTFTWTNFKLVLTDKLKDLRKLIFNYILQKNNLDVILKFIDEYCDAMRPKTKKSILKYDTEFLIPYIEKNMNPNIYLHCSKVQSYIRFLGRNNISNKQIKDLKDKFTNRTFDLSQILRKDHISRKLRLEEKMSHKEIENYIEERLKNYFSNYTYEDYLVVLKDLQEIIKNSDDRMKFQYRYSFTKVLIFILKEDFSLFIKIIKKVIESGNKIKLYSRNLINKALILYPDKHNKIYKIILSKDYLCRDKWLYYFYVALPSKIVNSFYVEELLSFFKKLKTELQINFDFLEKYEEIDSQIYIRIIDILNLKKEKVSVDMNLLFREDTNIYNNLESLFNDNIETLEDIYLYQCNLNKNFDYNGEGMKKILELNSNFLLKYLDYLYEKNEYLSEYDDDRDYTFIWRMDNYKEIINNVIKYFLSLDIISKDFIKVFFDFNSDEEVKMKIINYIKNFIEDNAEDLIKIKLIFIPIVSYFSDKRKYFCKIYISNNKNFDDFKSIPLEPNSYSSWGGSFISVYEERIKFLESLLPIMDSIDYLQHRNYVKEKINYYKKQIERESKNNFIEGIF